MENAFLKVTSAILYIYSLWTNKQKSQEVNCKLRRLFFHKLLLHDCIAQGSGVRVDGVVGGKFYRTSHTLTQQAGPQFTDRTWMESTVVLTLVLQYRMEIRSYTHKVNNHHISQWWRCNTEWSSKWMYLENSLNHGISDHHFIHKLTKFTSDSLERLMKALNKIQCSSVRENRSPLIFCIPATEVFKAKKEKFADISLMR